MNILLNEHDMYMMGWVIGLFLGMFITVLFLYLDNYIDKKTFKTYYLSLPDVLKCDMKKKILSLSEDINDIVLVSNTSYFKYKYNDIKRLILKLDSHD